MVVIDLMRKCIWKGAQRRNVYFGPGKLKDRHFHFALVYEGQFYQKWLKTCSGMFLSY